MARTDSKEVAAVTFTPVGVVESEFASYASSDEMRKRPRVLS